MAFRCNVGGAERAARVGIGVFLVVLAAFGVFSGTLRIAGFVVGGILLLTGAIKWCPLSALFGISTCKSGEKTV